MKKWSVIVGVALIVVCGIADLVHEFAANDPVRYFAEQPQHLLYVAAIAVAGGLAAFVVDRLSRRAQRQVRLFAWGAAASVLTVFWCYMLYQTASLSSVIAASGNTSWLLLALLLCAVIAAYLWFEFYSAWKTHTTD
ncbi:MAG: hypothetical protein HYY24_23320 [Verrucomicrobia bacterium]|nr:hypothetical protein [Verrucomicrobiota bacterium]